MDSRELIPRLEGLGLSNKEARVYLACLKLGSASVQAIAEQSGVKRVTAYVILESLQGLGLARQSTRAKKTCFTAEDPVRLRALLQRRSAELSAQVQALDFILPELSDLRIGPKDTSELRAFEGYSKVKEVFVDFITTSFHSNQKIWIACNWNRLGTMLEDWPQLASGSRMIYTAGHRLSRDLGFESRFLPSQQYPLAADIALSQDKVIMITTSSHSVVTAVVVKNPTLSAALQTWFELAWSAVVFSEMS